MYCKFISAIDTIFPMLVLIVAKCIVNTKISTPNSSKIPVLIVAKCIVNILENIILNGILDVLIVAKCIVNLLSPASKFSQNLY